MNQKLNVTLKKLSTKFSSYKFDLYHKKHAQLDLKIIEKVKGKTDPKLIKLANEYAVDVFGWKGYAPWLYVYAAFTETFKEGWIPNNYYGKVVVPQIQGNYGKISYLKPLAKKIFKSEVFPDIAYFVNGFFYANNYTQLQEKNIHQYLFATTDVVVYKLDNSLQGLGIYFFNKQSFDLKKIQQLGNGVFQKFIKQHPLFAEFMPNSVATLRITTAINNEGITSIRGCFLRLGRKGDTHINEVSEIVVPIDFVTGEFSKSGYIDGWIASDKHPDSLKLYAGKKIPNFQNCVTTVLELHQQLPYVRCIGWDLIVDEQEQINLMEWNGLDNDIKVSEATQGPCFSDMGWEHLWKN